MFIPFRHFHRMVFFLAFILTLGGEAIAQSPNFPVRASVTIVNSSPYLEDYGRDGNMLVVLTLVDNQPNYQGLLRFTIEGNGYRAETRDLVAQAPISLNFGAPVILRGPDLAPYFDLNNLNVEGIATENTLGNGGALPDGPITICVEVYDVNRFTDPPVSNPACAIRFVQQNYPPELVRPLGQLELPATQTSPAQRLGFRRNGLIASSVSVLNFSWNPRHVPQPADDEYVMELWKKIPGLTNDQIIRSSGRSRQPIITRVPRYTYTNYDSRLEIGAKYIWRVQVRDRRGVRQFVNDGYSSPGEFTYGTIPEEEIKCLGASALFAANVTDKEATISWENPAATTSSGYQIRYRAVGQGNWTDAGSAPITATTFALTGLEPETNYEVEVCANCKSDAPECVSIPFTTMELELIDCGPMPDPSTFAITNNSLRVIWDHIPQAAGYVLSWKKIPNPNDPVEAQQQAPRTATDGESPVGGGTGNTGPPANNNRIELPEGATEAVTSSNLQAGYTYRLELCKICLDGREECFEWEVPFNGYVDYCSEDVQPNTAVVSGSETQNNMDLGWTYSGMNVLPEGYDLRVVYHPTTEPTNRDTTDLPGTMTGTTVTGLSVGTDYTFEVCVICPDGEERCATTTGTTDPFSCPDPTELEAAVVVTPVIPDGIMVDWSELGPATNPAGWSFALLNMAGDTLQKAIAETGYQTTFTNLDAETEYRVAICHQCPVAEEPQCAEKTVFLPGCEAAELALTEGTVHFDFVELSWTDVGAEEYTVTFAEQGGTPLADPQTTENTEFRLGGLRPTTTYEISVCFECGVEPVCDTIVLTTIGVNCALAGDYEYDFECGINVSLQDPENQQLVETLNPGDSIWAGDFLVEIAEITGNTTFGGFGRTKIPYLKNAKLRLDFHEIQVNEDCRMVAGKMVIKSPLEAALEQLQQGLQDLQDILGEIDDFLGSISSTLGSISSVLDQIATAADVNAEANAVLDQLVIALDQVPYLPDSYVEAVEDAANCLKQAAISNNDEAVRNCRDQLQEAIQNAQDYIDDLFDADFIVDFAPTVPATSYWGLDSQRYDLVTEGYDQRTIGGTPYKVPWASTSTEEPAGVPFGAVRRDNGTMQPVNFIGSDTQPYPGWTKEATSASNPGLSADGDQETKVVFAAHDNPDAEEGNDSIPPVKLAGQLNLVTYTPVRHTVHIVPINNAALPQDAGQVQEALNRIYRPSVAEWTVAIEPNINVDDFAGTLQDIPNSLLSNYTPQMNSLKNVVQGQTYYDGDHYYLLVVPRMAEPDRLGFMPRKRSFGFLSAERLTDGTSFNRTVAHELGHGAFHLQHIYDRFDGLTAASTDNLMDSGSGETLFKYQWDNVHDPESNFTLFDDEDEGESVAVLEDRGPDSGETDPPTNSDCIADPPLTLAQDEILLSRSGMPMFLPAGSKVSFYKENYYGKGMVESFALPTDSPGDRYVAYTYNDTPNVPIELHGLFSGYSKPSDPNAKISSLAVHYTNTPSGNFNIPTSSSGTAVPLKIGIQRGCDAGDDANQGIGYLYDIEYTGSFEDLSAAVSWDVPTQGTKNRMVGPKKSYTDAYPNNEYNIAAAAAVIGPAPDPKATNVVLRSCIDDVSVYNDQIDDIQGFILDATPEYIFDLCDPNALTSPPPSNFYVTKFEPIEFSDGTSGYMGLLKVAGELRQVAVYYYLNEINFYVYFEDCGWVHGNLVDRTEMPFIEALLGTFVEVLSSPEFYITVSAIVVGVVVASVAAPFVIAYLGVTGGAAIATGILLDVVVVGGLEALAWYTLEDDPEKAKEALKWSAVGGVAGGLLGPLFRKIKLLKQAIRASSETAEQLAKKSNDLAEVVVKIKRADGTIAEVKPKQIADEAEALFTGGVPGKSDAFLDELFEGTDEFRLFFADAGEDFASRVLAWEARNVAGVSSTLDELTLLSKFIKNNPGTVIADVGQAIAARGTIDEWVEAVIQAGKRSGNPKLSKALSDFGFVRSAEAVSGAGNISTKVNTALEEAAGDIEIPNFIADYTKTRGGVTFQKAATETYQQYFDRLVASGEFNPYIGHHIFPVEMLKEKGFRLWYESVGHVNFPLNTAFPDNTPSLRNMIMLENYATANGLGTHASHNTYNTTLRTFLGSQWDGMMSSAGGNVDDAIDLFDDMMSSLGPNLKQALLSNSAIGNTRVNQLFTGSNPVNLPSLID